MGLDNIPNVLPCQKAGTAVMVANSTMVSCEQTQHAGGCPWKTNFEKDQPGTPVLGMMGAECWYRGKMGESLLTQYNELNANHDPDYPGGFFGDGNADENEPDLSVDYCLDLAWWMMVRTTQYAELLLKDGHSAADIQSTLEYWGYAIWWLQFVANCGDGAVAWY